jgi:uncharacterized membrane protein YraQ (UPF0718 family)
MHRRIEVSVQDFIVDFMGVFYEAMPFLALGALISGILEEMVPQQVMARFIPRNPLLAIMLGALLGLIFPMCDCGIVPIMRRLLRKRVPLSVCTAYMLAGPIVNVVVILSTIIAFRPHYARGGYAIIGLRVVLGYLVACGTALVVHRQYKKYGNELLTPLAQPDPPQIGVKTLAMVNQEAAPENEKNERKPIFQRLGNITETALHDFIDITVFLTLGAILAAASKQFFSAQQIAEWSKQYPALAILCMMGLAIIICLCSEADAFIAATFTTLHPSAKIAFLVLGPMLDFKLLMMFTRVFRARMIWTIIVCLIVQVFIYSMLCYYLWPEIHKLEEPFIRMFMGPDAVSAGAGV